MEEYLLLQEAFEDLEAYMEEQERKQRGGHRDNAGRKPKDGVGSVHIGLRVNKYHLQMIDDNFMSRSAFICAAIKEKLIRERLL